MKGLSLKLLGSFEAAVDGRPLTKFRTNKAKALLIYLAVEGMVGRRETLGTMLWPEMPQKAAQRNLRQTVYILRGAVAEAGVETEADFLISNSLRVSIHSDFPCEVDVTTFTSLLQQVEDHLHAEPLSCPECRKWLEEAAELYRGDFLADFYLRDSIEFEEWAQGQREALRRSALAALEKLAAMDLRSGQYLRAEKYARRQLKIDELHEAAHRQMMEALARDGERLEALAHFRSYRELLAEELGVEPSAQTRALYEGIKAGELAVQEVDRRTETLPTFLAEAAEEPQGDEGPFVAREAELGRLEASAEKMLAGEGQVLFVAGEAGMGKTRLMQTFTRALGSRRPDLLTVFGGCTLSTTVGDPYLPFRQVLTSLIGGVESQWRTGALLKDQARRLWEAAPQVLASLAEKGPNLIGTLLPVDRLQDRVRAVLPHGHPTLARLEALLADSQERMFEGPRHFFEQTVNLLLALARRQPLLIILDDLQWIDAASAELLFRLGRALPSGRLMVLGAYRPDEVAAQAAHPLRKVLHEFRLSHGDISLNLDEIPGAERQDFVDAYLDTQPNDLDTDFRQMLCDHTEGNPLMTIETLRNMQARGDLVRNPEGRWVEGGKLAWDQLPSQVEGVVQERIGRLEAPLRQILSAASVEGEVFTVQVIAASQGLEERTLLRQLNQELEGKHRLVSEEGVLRVNGNRLFRYRFRHTVFRQYLYQSMGQIERELLHMDVGNTLEKLFADQLEEILPQLAWHFSSAQEGEKALRYLTLAGDRARDQYAQVEALSYYRQALDWARRQGQTRLAAQTLMKLGQVHSTTYDFEAARKAFDEGFGLWQQIEYGQPSDDAPPATEELRLDWPRPATLDPALSDDTFTQSLVEQLFWGLVELTPQLALVPGAAKQWDIRKSGREYVFHLRPGLRWHDGHPLTAADFAFAWQRILDPATGSPHAAALYVIDGAQAFHEGRTDAWESVGLRCPNDQTLVVELGEPSSIFLQVMASSLVFPTPQHVIEKHGPAWTRPGRFVGNGPFELSEWKGDKEMILTRSPTYSGMRTGNVRRVKLGLADRWEGSWTERLANYEAGTSDVCFLRGGSLPEMKQAQARHASEYVAAPRFGFGYIIFDSSRPPFDDRRVRQAMSSAIDRRTLANVILAGYEFPATGGFIPPSMPGHLPDIGRRYAPSEAVQLLASAGYPGGAGCPPIRLLHVRPSHEADYLVKQWEGILGLKIQLETAGRKNLMERLTTHRPHMIVLNAAASFPDPAAFLRWTALFEYAGILRSQRLAELLGKPWGTTYRADRIALFREVDKLVVEQAAAVPLTYLRTHFLLSPRIQHFPVSPLRWWYWRDVVVGPE